MRHAIILLFLLWQYSLFAQLNGKYNFRNIDPSDGLLYSHIKGIGQDKRGFIWIVTINGLQRYDGSRFVNYPQITENSPFGSLSDCQLYVDTAHDQVCVIKWQQMDRLDLADNTWSSLTIKDFLDRDTMAQQVKFVDEFQRKWTASAHGFILENEISNEVQSYFDIHTGDQHYGKNIIRDTSSGVYWMGGYNHFLIADINSRKIDVSSGPHPENNLLNEFWTRYGNDSRIRLILLDSYHNLWIATWRHYLHRYNLDTKQFYTYSLKDVKSKQNDAEKGDLTLLINAAYEDRERNLWIATDYAGLLLYNREKDDFDFITSDEKIRNGLRYDYSITTIFQDREDNIWLGTDRGISVFNPYRDYFQAIRHLDGNDASIPKKDINDVIQTQQGEILIATWGGGISVFDAQWNFKRNIDFKGAPELNLVWSFVQHDDGMIWGGTQQGYIHQYDPVTHSITTIHPAEVENSTIVDMARDREGNILLGLSSGRATLWEKSTKKFYAMDRSSPNTFQNNSVVNIFADQNNRYWVTNAYGLREYDVKRHMYSELLLPDSIKASVGVKMNGMEQYNDSMLIIGTVYRGIYVFNTNTLKFSRLTSDDQLNHSSVFAVKRDHEGNIWFTGNYSLHKLTSGFQQTVIYNIDQVMMNAAFSSRSLFELTDGRWVTNTPAEIICFNPDYIESKQREPSRIEISGFRVFDKPLYIDSFLQQDKPVILPYNENFITIEFSTLDFADVRQTNYLYRLDGINKDWIRTTSHQVAEYTDLKPGQYVFEIKAEQGNGYSKVTSFPIIINPPWWGTFWFRISLLLALGIAGYWIFKKRIQQVRQQSELRHRVAEMEMKALRAQMNPHFIFNCLSSIDNLIQTDQKLKATDYLAKFALLIRAILENSKANSIPCWKDLEALQLYLELESLRWENQIIFQMDVEPQIHEGDYKVPPLVIQPFVENAIHHGLLNKLDGAKKLDIDVRMQGQRIKYTITDNGVGRLQAAEYKKLNKWSQASYGVQMTNERIGLFNQHANGSIIITDLYDHESRPSGTMVEVWLNTQPNKG